MTATEPTTTPSTDLALPSDGPIVAASPSGMNPRALAAKINFATQAAQADLLPAQYRRKPANVLLAIEYGELLGLHWLTAVQQVHNIEGKLSMSAELMRSRVRAAGHKFRTLERSPTKVTVQIVRHDDPDYPVTVTWTKDDAERAKLWGKDNWKKYPTDMLFARATSAAVRDACPEVLMGVSYTPDELGADVDDEGNVLDVTETAPQPTLEDLSASVSVGWAKSEILKAFDGNKEASTRAWERHFAGRVEAGEGLTVGDVRAFLANATVEQFRDGNGAHPPPEVEDATGDEVEIVDPDDHGDDLPGLDRAAHDAATSHLDVAGDVVPAGPPPQETRAQQVAKRAARTAKKAASRGKPEMATGEHIDTILATELDDAQSEQLDRFLAEEGVEVKEGVLTLEQYQRVVDFIDVLVDGGEAF